MGVSQQISLFRSQIQNGRFDDGTIRILESALACKDVKSLIEVRLTLKEFMRNESLRVFREITDKSVDHKLIVSEFFVRAFALIGDVESCLALRYEAYIMRDQKAASDTRLNVSHNEWLVFAQQSLDNEFYSIAMKACDRALLSIPMNSVVDPKIDGCSNCSHLIEKIKSFKVAAMKLASSQSGMAEVLAAEYMKKKIVKELTQQAPVCNETQSSGRIMFRNGIKRRNLRKLQEHRCLQQATLENRQCCFEDAEN